MSRCVPTVETGVTWSETLAAGGKPGRRAARPTAAIARCPLRLCENAQLHRTKLVEEEEQLQKAVHRGKIEVFRKKRFREIGEKTAGKRLPGGSIQKDKEIIFLFSVLSAATEEGFHQNAEPIKIAFHLPRIFGIPQIVSNFTDLVPERRREKPSTQILFGALIVIKIEPVFQNECHDVQQVQRDDRVFVKLYEKRQAASQQLLIQKIHTKQIS